jgi:hypothetical protein
MTWIFQPILQNLKGVEDIRVAMVNAITYTDLHRTKRLDISAK